MSIQQDIKNQIKEAMRAKNELRLSVVRGVLAALTNELVAQKRKPSEELGDDDALTVIKRLAKQRKDSIEQFRAGGREDLANREESELKILDNYLPTMMNREEIEKIAEIKKAELGLGDKSQAGQLMAAMMKELKGQADGADVKAVIDKLLS